MDLWVQMCVDGLWCVRLGCDVEIEQEDRIVEVRRGVKEVKGT